MDPDVLITIVWASVYSLNAACQSRRSFGTYPHIPIRYCIFSPQVTSRSTSKSIIVILDSGWLGSSTSELIRSSIFLILTIVMEIGIKRRRRERFQPSQVFPHHIITLCLSSLGAVPPSISLLITDCWRTSALDIVFIRLLIPRSRSACPAPRPSAAQPPSRHTSPFIWTCRTCAPPARLPRA